MYPDISSEQRLCASTAANFEQGNVAKLLVTDIDFSSHSFLSNFICFPSQEPCRRQSDNTTIIHDSSSLPRNADPLAELCIGSKPYTNTVLPGGWTCGPCLIAPRLEYSLSNTGEAWARRASPHVPYLPVLPQKASLSIFAAQERVVGPGTSETAASYAMGIKFGLKR